MEVRHFHLIQFDIEPHKCTTKWHINSLNDLNRVHTCGKRQTTDHATEKCATASEIACARAIQKRFRLIITKLILNNSAIF